jgi:4-diphosphocytidyl-2-C-methyl-D-erythritol kinase
LSEEGDPEARPRAKINLTLAVGPRRPDGFHEIRSVFLLVGLADLLGVATGEGSDDTLEPYTGAQPAALRGGGTDDLVLRAARELRAELGSERPPALVFRLDKRIPVAAGLGGGSSDAAAALTLAAKVWGLGLAHERKQTVAARVGSDVPFFASGARAALVGGRGEIVMALEPPRGPVGVLLVTPGTRLSTADVFAAFDELREPTSASADATDELAASLARGMSGEALAKAAATLRDANDLWPAAVALAPELAALREASERVLGRPMLLTGSGATMFCLYPSLDHAVAAGRTLVEVLVSGLAEARVAACDLAGPDPVWRFP